MATYGTQYFMGNVPLGYLEGASPSIRFPLTVDYASVTASQIKAYTVDGGTLFLAPATDAPTLNALITISLASALGRQWRLLPFGSGYVTQARMDDGRSWALVVVAVADASPSNFRVIQADSPLTVVETGVQGYRALLTTDYANLSGTPKVVNFFGAQAALNTVAGTSVFALLTAGGVSAAFSPADLTELKVWFDPSRLAGADGSQVATVTDFESGWDATRTPSAAVVLKTNILNGKAILRYDGTAGFLLPAGALDLFRNIGSCAIVSVVAYKDALTFYSPFGAANGAGATRLALFANYPGNANKFTAGGRRLDADSFAVVHGGVMTPDQWVVQSAIYDFANSNLYLYINETLVASTTSFQTDGNTSNTASLSIRLGDSTGGGFMKGDQADTLVCVPAPSVVDLLKMVNYEKDKYALTFP